MMRVPCGPGVGSVLSAAVLLATAACGSSGGTAASRDLAAADVGAALEGRCYRLAEAEPLGHPQELPLPEGIQLSPEPNPWIESLPEVPGEPHRCGSCLLKFTGGGGSWEGEYTLWSPVVSDSIEIFLGVPNAGGIVIDAAARDREIVGTAGVTSDLQARGISDRRWRIAGTRIACEGNWTWGATPVAPSPGTARDTAGIRRPRSIFFPVISRRMPISSMAFERVRN